GARPRQGGVAGQAWAPCRLSRRRRGRPRPGGRQREATARGQARSASLPWNATARDDGQADLAPLLPFPRATGRSPSSLSRLRSVLRLIPSRRAALSWLPADSSRAWRRSGVSTLAITLRYSRPLSAAAESRTTIGRT